MTMERKNWNNERIAWLESEITRLYRELANMPVYSSMSIDGVQVSIDRNAIRTEIAEYQAELRQLKGSRPVISTIEFDQW